MSYAIPYQLLNPKRSFISACILTQTSSSAFAFPIAQWLRSNSKKQTPFLQQRSCAGISPVFQSRLSKSCFLALWIIYWFVFILLLFSPKVNQKFRLFYFDVFFCIHFYLKEQKRGCTKSPNKKAQLYFLCSWAKLFKKTAAKGVPNAAVWCYSVLAWNKKTP